MEYLLSQNPLIKNANCPKDPKGPKDKIPWRIKVYNLIIGTNETFRGFTCRTGIHFLNLG